MTGDGRARMVSSAFHSIEAVVALLTILAPGVWQTPLYKLGSKPVQAVCKGESGALN